MAGWGTFHDFKPKLCAVCGKEFVPKSGVHKFCSTSCKGKQKYIMGWVTTQNQYEAISGNWERYLSRLLYYGGRKRDMLTREILMEQLRRQNYLCALSGVPLTCTLKKGTSCATNASVDRVTAGGAYTADNIQLVCRALNHWRADTSVPDFIEWCRKVVAYADSQRSGAGKGEYDHGETA